MLYEFVKGQPYARIIIEKMFMIISTTLQDRHL